MNRKTTKKALALSALSLLLCVSMLVGTTFAWFTDSVSSGKNVIAAGNLDIELEYSKDFQNWNSVQGKTDLVDPNAKWEPGHTEVVYLRLTNKGSLALKYNFNMNVANAVIGKSVLGNDIALADYLKYDIVDVTAKYASRQAARDAVAATAETLASYEVAGTMTAQNETKTLALVVYMPEDIGDEANYRGTQPTIELGLELNATQLMNEKDSFNSEYDEGAYLSTVYSAAELASALSQGESVKLGDDIVGTETFTIPANTKVTLDLNGYSVDVSIHKNDGHVIDNDGELTLVGGTVASTADNGGSAIRNDGTLIVDGTTIAGAPKVDGSWPSYAINNYGDMTLTDVTITSNHGAISCANGGETVLKNVDVTMNGMGGSSHVIYIFDTGTKLTIESGEYVHAGNADGSLAYIMTGTEVIVNGGSFYASNGGYGMATYTGSLTINGGYFDVLPVNWGGPISVTGGTFAKDPSSFVASGYAAYQNTDGTWTVESAINTTEEMKNAISNAASGDTIELASGNYSMPSVSNKELTISGTKNTVVNVTSSPAMHGSDISFEGVTVVSEGGGFKSGVQHANTVTYKDATIVGSMSLYGEKVVFENCTFDLTGISDYIWVYGTEEAEFIGCTFNTLGKAILIYNEGYCDNKVTVKNCVFNASTGAKAGAINNQNCAAIELDNRYMNADLTCSGNTVGSNFSGEWRIKTYSDAKTITINGVNYTSIAIDGKTMTIDSENNVTVIE